MSDLFLACLDSLSFHFIFVLCLLSPRPKKMKTHLIPPTMFMWISVRVSVSIVLQWSFSIFLTKTQRGQKLLLFITVGPCLMWILRVEKTLYAKFALVQKSPTSVYISQKLLVKIIWILYYTVFTVVWSVYKFCRQKLCFFPPAFA